ncbi:YhgE/Pip domain-containing protein [Paenibacillus sp. R14(2021)]|uniref:YhgE/Pip domain-containing protein n=1 Tax=Paenibacillus sp. R14(2021) TaxID=2859228 RepID=UPI001C61390B|nr:ABC transporter permease [Paenibacillus sp. R14(2021)]
MFHFFRQRHPFLTLIIVFVVILVLGWAQLGSSVNPVPKDLPVILVQLDSGANTPDGQEMNFGKLISDKITAAEGPNGVQSPLLWNEAKSEEDAIAAMNNEAAYAALLIPADFSRKLTSLLSPNPEPAKVTLFINQGMNYNGSTITNQVMTQIMSGVNSQIRNQILNFASGHGGTLTVNQTKALALPVMVDSRNVNAVGTDSANGNAPVVLTQLIWFGAMVATMMLFIAAGKATQHGLRMHRLEIRLSQIAMGAVATGVASLSVVYISGKWIGLYIPDYSDIGWFLFFAGFVFFLIQTTLVSWIGFAGVPLIVLVFFFGAPILSIPPQMLPQFSHHFLYSWLPMRFSVEGLRDLFYFSGYRNLSAPAWTLAVIGAVCIGLIVLSVLKKHSADLPDKETASASSVAQ